MSTDLPVGLDGLFEMQEGLDPQAVHGEESTASEGEYWFTHWSSARCSCPCLPLFSYLSIAWAGQQRDSHKRKGAPSSDRLGRSFPASLVYPSSFWWVYKSCVYEVVNAVEAPSVPCSGVLSLLSSLRPTRAQLKSTLFRSSVMISPSTLVLPGVPQRRVPCPVLSESATSATYVPAWLAVSSSSTTLEPTLRPCRTYWWERERVSILGCGKSSLVEVAARAQRLRVVALMGETNGTSLQQTLEQITTIMQCQSVSFGKEDPPLILLVFLWERSEVGQLRHFVQSIRAERNCEASC